MGEERKAAALKQHEEMAQKTEKMSYHYTQAEKRIKSLDKEVADYKIRTDGMSQELFTSQNQCRNMAAELFRTKNGFEEAMTKLEDVKAENVALAIEIRD